MFASRVMRRRVEHEPALPGPDLQTSLLLGSSKPAGFTRGGGASELACIPESTAFANQCAGGTRVPGANIYLIGALSFSAPRSAGVASHAFSRSQRPAFRFGSALDGACVGQLGTERNRSAGRAFACRPKSCLQQEGALGRLSCCCAQEGHANHPFQPALGDGFVAYHQPRWRRQVCLPGRWRWLFHVVSMRLC